MKQELLKEIRIKKIKLGVSLLELEERIVSAIMCGAAPELIEESKILWRQGKEWLHQMKNISSPK